MAPNEKGLALYTQLPPRLIDEDATLDIIAGVDHPQGERAVLARFAEAAQLPAGGSRTVLPSVAWLTICKSQD
jgi:hypothetical protein